MSRGTILINKTKSGFEVRCDLGDGKPPRVLLGFGIEKEMRGKVCELELEKGQPVRVTIGEKEYRKQPAQRYRAQETTGAQGFGKKTGGRFTSSPPGAGGAAGSHGAPHAGNALAPYNFIPLNEKPVSFPEGPAKCHHLWREECFSGHISLKIEALTPLYIRGTSSDPAIQNKNIRGFFGPGGILRIPGSSLRGMVRTLVEIASFGRFGADHTRVNKRLYYRGIGDKSELRYLYHSDMIDKNDNYFPKVKAGILKREHGKLMLYPSASVSGTQIYRIEGSFDSEDQFYVAGTGMMMKEYTFSNVFFHPEAPSLHTHYRQNRQGNQVSYQLKYASINRVSDTPSPGMQKGYLVCSGRFGEKKHMQWIINAPIAKGIEVPEAVETDYREDSNREEEITLLDSLGRYGEVPCFYIPESGNPDSVRAIGHTALFRLPYKKTVGDHIPGSLAGSGPTDCAGAVFGILEKWAGRVSFEDAALDPGQTSDVLKEELSPRILSGPKPTTFQHYLEPLEGKGQHWDSSAQLRGYKLYWHRKTPETGPFAWRKETIVEDGQHTVIQPVETGARFTGRIRFDNLSGEELGALLFVLDLPAGCRHKIGMGKPLGLGSVKTTPTVVLTARKDRYGELFSGEGWNLEEFSPENGAFTEAFEEFVLARMSPADRNGAASLWNTPRMRELKSMLDWSKAESGGDDWLRKTRYMEIEHPQKGNEFRDQPVLGRPTET